MQARSPLAFPVLKHLWIILLTLCLSCASRGHESTASPVEYVPAELQPGQGTSIISESTLDTNNQYAFTVFVSVGPDSTCSGVVIDPAVVLTAGHCLCAKRRIPSSEPPGTMLIDRSTCPPSATVKAFTYTPPKTGAGNVLPALQVITGAVRPHDDLRILYNAQGQEVSSNSDLAAVILERPLKNIKPVPLATRQVQVNEPVVLVGYGQTQLGDPPSNQRHFGRNEVATIETSGATFFIGKPILIRNPYTAKELLLVREKASYSLAGDSGGPCLRERRGAFELVGIAKTVYGNDQLVQFSEYTSTYAYLGWLRDELKKARKANPD